MKIYKPVSLTLMILFAITGLLFLFIPDRVLGLFNALSSFLNLPQAPVTGHGIYVILTGGYMYLVTMLAFLMFKHPQSKYFPFLLIHAKIVSSVLSLAMFVVQGHYLIYLANFLVDGFIAAGVAALYFKMGRLAQWASY